MIPFAIEVGKHIDSALRGRIRNQADVTKQTPLAFMYQYLLNLYPTTFEHNKLNFHVGLSLKESQIYVKRWENGRDIYVLITIVSKLSKPQAHPATVTQIYKNKKISLRERHSFAAAIKDTAHMLNTYANIVQGYVVVIADNEKHWQCDVNKSLNWEQKTLGLTGYKNLTYFPKTDKTPAFQAVWMPTRYEHYRYCLATLGGTTPLYNLIDNKENYVNERKSSNEYFIPHHDTIDGWRPRETNKEVKRYKSKEEEKKKMSAPLLFQSMLTEGRFARVTRERKTWETSSLNDYSRVIMSPALRRLKDKTQVFSLETSDFVRVRLTHSLEVAHIARLIGSGIEKNLLNKYSDAGNLSNYNRIHEILEVAGLVHDIGNPPFGHFGERTIRNYFKHPENMPQRVRTAFESLSEEEKADFCNFDGNVQGLRILRHLGLSNDWSSYNLNKVVLSTIIKYPFSSTEGNKCDTQDHRRKKFGFFCSEADTYKEICRYLNLKAGQRHPLTYILEAADDIAYMGDDIEDGWKLGYISTHALTEEIRRISDAMKQYDKSSNNKKELKKQKKEGIPTFIKIFREDAQNLLTRINSGNSFVIAHAIQSIRISMQRYLIDQCVDIFCEHFEDIVKNNLPANKQELLQYDEITNIIIDMWKALVKNCYNSIHRTQLSGERAIRKALDVFLETVFSDNLVTYKKFNIGGQEIYRVYPNIEDKEGMIYEILSDNYREDMSPVGLYVPYDAYSRFQLVVDYVSGMTDSYAYDFYKEFNNE